MLLQHSSTLLLSISSCVCDVRVPAATILPAEHSPPRHSHCSQSWSPSQTSLVHDLLGTFCCFIFYIVFKGYSPFIVIKIYSLLLITASVFHFRLFHNWQFDLGVFLYIKCFSPYHAHFSCTFLRHIILLILSLIY